MCVMQAQGAPPTHSHLGEELCYLVVMTDHTEGSGARTTRFGWFLSGGCSLRDLAKAKGRPP